MKTTDVPVKLSCPNCSKEVAFPNDVSDDKMIICQSCGEEVATAGDIRTAANLVMAKAAKAEVRKGLKRATKGLKYIKFK